MSKVENAPLLTSFSKRLFLFLPRNFLNQVTYRQSTFSNFSFLSVFYAISRFLYVVCGHVIRAYSTQTGELVRDYKGLTHSAVGVQLHATRPELVVAVSEKGEMMAWRWETGIHMLTVVSGVEELSIYI